ncbi:protein HIDE1 [Cuculus canorus]|uniref:protein HIDE1 n=1 Tax=Cuculus canorus TaxID=55661 RepID=UPI0023AACBF6|nr:protein HIDE1 [Cuculus canorus]
MRLEFLLLVAGAAAALGLSPPPLGLVLPQDEGPLKIRCLAPRSYTGSTFELFPVGASAPVQSVAAEPDQHMVDFPLDEATPPSRCYRCRYRSYNGSAWQVSAFSVELVVNASDDSGCHAPTAAPTVPVSTALQQGRSWLVPVAVSAAVLVLLLLAAAAAAAWRVEARRQRAKRERVSCWTETQFPTTELSYDNCAYAASVIPQAGAVGGSSPVLASPHRDSRASPAAAPHFSTFRSLA